VIVGFGIDRVAVARSRSEDNRAGSWRKRRAVEVEPAHATCLPSAHMTTEATPPRALIDASNVAHASVAHAGEGSSARLANILLVRDKLAAQGFDVIIVADAALRHQIDEPDAYERLVADGTIHQAPAGTDADYFLLSFAKELDAALVSNDRFRDRSRQFAAVRRRIIRYMILADEVVFERRTTRRDRSSAVDFPRRRPRG
jgi:Zc3h12a-like Ribonuclease NYN domain